MTIFIHLSFSFLSTVTFGILTNIPKRALVATGIAGTVGWMIYWSLKTIGYGLGSANFLAAFAVGCVSIFFSRRKKMPMITFLASFLSYRVVLPTKPFENSLWATTLSALKI